MSYSVLHTNGKSRYLYNTVETSSLLLDLYGANVKVGYSIRKLREN